MDRPRKVAKPASAVSVVSTYSEYICTGTVLLFALVYIPGIFSIRGHVHLFVHGSTVVLSRVEYVRMRQLRQRPKEKEG